MQPVAPSTLGCRRLGAVRWQRQSVSGPGLIKQHALQWCWLPKPPPHSVLCHRPSALKHPLPLPPHAHPSLPTHRPCRESLPRPPRHPPPRPPLPPHHAPRARSRPAHISLRPERPHRRRPAARPPCRVRFAALAGPGRDRLPAPDGAPAHGPVDVSWDCRG